jgi:hypothetical protein
MAKVRAHLSNVQTMTAGFTQTDARGRSAAGTLQLKKPGRVRFQYGSGDLLLVANGKTLTFVDYQVGQKSSGRSAAPARRAVVGEPRPQGPRAGGQATTRGSSSSARAIRHSSAQSVPPSSARRQLRAD